MTLGLANLKVVNHDRAVELFRRSLVGENCRDKLAINCALARNSLWAHSQGTIPVHVLRITNLALASSPGSAPEDLSSFRERFREALEELADAGDVIGLQGGRWLSAPVRQVDLGTLRDDRLIVGGIPTNLLPRDLASTIVHHGPFRRIRGEAIPTVLDLPRESFKSWVGSPPDDLRRWAESLMNVQVEPYTEPREGGHFRVYVPGRVPPRTPQGFRWADQMGGLDGKYFAYREMPFGMRQPRILQVSRGRIIGVATPNLGSGDSRRLLYALDDIAGNPTEIETERRGGSLELTLKSEVPRAERRSFATLGQVATSSDRYYPRVWSFDVAHATKVLEFLAPLKVQIIEKRARRVKR